MKFIDLFAGIGGFRIALENHGQECVFTSEIDKYCQKYMNIISVLFLQVISRKLKQKIYQILIFWQPVFHVSLLAIRENWKDSMTKPEEHFSSIL